MTAADALLARMNKNDSVDVPTPLAVLVAHWMAMQGRLADKASRQKVEYLSKPINAVPQLAWAASVDGRFLYCNCDLRGLLGDCENQPVESAMLEVLPHAVDRQRWLGVWRGALESGHAYEVEYRLRFSDGSGDHWYLERGMPRERASTAERWFVTATRIDEQKRRDEDLLALLDREEQFFATLVDELRSPLLPIANALELLASRSDDPKTVIGARGVIQLQLRQLTRLVDDLLDASSIARGAIDFHKDRVDVADIVAAAIEIARPSRLDHLKQWSCVRTQPPAPRQLDPGQ